MAVPPLTLNPSTTWIALHSWFGQTNLSRIFNNSPHLLFLHNTKNPYKCAGYLYEIPTNVNFCEHYLRFSKVRRARKIPSFAIMKALIKGIAAVIRCNALRLVALQRCALVAMFCKVSGCNPRIWNAIFCNPNTPFSLDLIRGGKHFWPPGFIVGRSWLGGGGMPLF